MLLNTEPSLQSLFLFSRFFYLRTLAHQITILDNLLKFTYVTNILIFYLTCVTCVYVCAHACVHVSVEPRYQQQVSLFALHLMF